MFFMEERLKMAKRGMETYNVITPDKIYKGKTYADLAADWFNWFVCSDSDNHNLGPVVFLRSKVIPKSITRSVSDRDNEAMATDGNYTGYKNEPNVKVGPERLQIYADQALLVPIIVAYAEASKPYDDWGTLQEYTGLTIENGDNPPKPNQLTIDGDPLTIDGKNLIMEDYRIITPVFTAIVPDSAYGRSVKDFLEMPLAPGPYPTVVDGYFVLLRFNLPGKYFVHSFASAGREILGPYFSQLFYQIEVNRRPDIDTTLDENGVYHDKSLRPHRGSPGVQLARDEKIIAETIIEKLKNGELSKTDMEKISKPLSKIINFDVVQNYKDFVGSPSNRPKRKKRPL
jgi:hypothetical protein